MFIVLLRFSTNKPDAGQYMQEHQAWVDRGVEDGVFLLVGSIQPGLGGAILASDESLDAVKRRVDQDPFVEHDVVSAEILEIEPARAHQRLAFLMS